MSLSHYKLCLWCSEKYLLAKLALIRSPASVFGGRVLDDVLLAEDRDAADLAVELPDGEREGGVVEDGAVRAVVQRVNELQVAATTV